MHPNPIFRKTTTDRNLAFAQGRGFGTLAVNADPSPLLANVPFLLADDGASADLHLVRSNPIARLGSAPVVLSVTGPDGYVSPDWYDTPDQVPTWNYVSVHLRGILEPLPAEDLQDLLVRQSAAFEDRLDKAPWTLGKMSEDALQKMLRQILPFRLHISAVDGTWKLNQNKSEAARIGAAEQMPNSLGQGLLDLANLMKDI